MHSCKFAVIVDEVEATILLFDLFNWDRHIVVYHQYIMVVSNIFDVL